MDKVMKRIEELEKEVQRHTMELGLVNQKRNELSTVIVSKNGALVELRKLISKKKESNGD